MHRLADCRSLLFMPAHNMRAIAKARGLPCDAVILDLEDAVPAEAKAAARAGLGDALREGFGARIAMVRINAADSGVADSDLTALADAPAAVLIVLPKVETPDMVADIHARTGRPVVAMIETPAGVARAQAIAAAPGCAALFAGTNDLVAAMGLDPRPTRIGLELALQSIVLAAALAGIPAFDGVCNALDDDGLLAAECTQGRAFGFRGKTLIHPAQIATANRIFLGSDATLAADAALVAEAGEDIGAVRRGGAMVEAMHVTAARARLDRARRLGLLPC
jgi:citrate lyase subunit beta/citryl-CoA lyase